MRLADRPTSTLRNVKITNVSGGETRPGHHAVLTRQVKRTREFQAVALGDLQAGGDLRRREHVHL
jgi:hypothetical protein